MHDERRYAPATLRNRDPILAVLRSYLRERGMILEIASGSGEHCVYFAENLHSYFFQPSDPDKAARASIDAWVKEKGLVNVLPAINIDASTTDWPVGQVSAVICINMIHITPWKATTGLFCGAASVLSDAGLLFTYGPYRCDGQASSEGNALFDASLRKENPEWGIRDVEAVIGAAGKYGFSPPVISQMPSNNMMLIFRKPNKTA